MRPPETRRPADGGQRADGRGDDKAILNRPDDNTALFDVRVAHSPYGTMTSYHPAAEMAQALETADPFWQATARQAVLALLEHKATICVDDLREGGLVPEPTNPNAWGAVFSALANAGRLQFVSYRKSRRRSSHSRVVAVWTWGPRYVVSERDEGGA